MHSISPHYELDHYSVVLFQSSEKFLHNFYKDRDKILQKKETKVELSKKWKDNKSIQQDLYSGKRKSKVSYVWCLY